MSRLSLALAFLAMFAVCAGAQAATYTWDGPSGAAGYWDALPNWGGGNFPGNSGNIGADTANFNFNTYGHNPIVYMDSAYGVSNLTLAGGASGYSGLLNVNGPYALTVTNGIVVGAYQGLGGNGTMIANGGIALSGGGTLAGTLRVTGNVTADNTPGNSFNPGETVAGTTHGTVGAIAITGGLTVTNGTFNMDLESNNTGTYDTITVSGALSAAGTVNINALPGYARVIGQNTYTLMTSGTLTSNTLVLGGTLPNTTGSLLTYTGGTNGIATSGKNVTFAVTRTAGTYVWTGGDGSSYNEWYDPANWNQGVLVPFGTSSGSTDIAQFNLGTTPLVVYLSSVVTTPSGTYYTGNAATIYSVSLNGAGALTLNGPSGSYSYFYGGLAVGANQTAQGNAWLQLGAPLTVGAGGMLGGTLTLVNAGSGSLVSTGGTFSPGTGVAGAGHTAGTLTSALTSTLDSNTTLNFNLGGNTANSDQITIYGTATLGGANVDLYNMGSMAAGNYTLMTYTRKSSTTDSLALGGTLPAGYTTANATLISYPTFVSALMGSTTYTWSGGTGPANWAAASNWGGASYPGTTPATDVASIPLANSPSITMNSPQTVAALLMTGTGTLAINGANALTVTNGITVGNSQILTGSGTINGNVYLYDSTTATATLGGSLSVNGDAGFAPGGFGGVFSPGTGANGSGHTPGTITVAGNLNPSGMATGNTQWNFNLSGPSSFDQIAVSGAAALAGSVNVYNSSGGSLAAGDYHIITYSSLGGYVPGAYLPAGGSITSGGSFTFAGTVATYPAGYSASNMMLAVSPTFVDLNVGGTQYTWNALGTGVWNDPTKWSVGTSYPGAAATDVAKIALSNGTSTITLNGAYTVPILSITGGTSNGTLILTSANSSDVLTVTDGIFFDPGVSQTIKPGAGGLYLNASLMMGGIREVFGDTTGANTVHLTGDVYMDIGGSQLSTLAYTTITGNLFLGNNYSATSPTLTGNISANSLTFYNGGNSYYVNASGTSTLTVNTGNMTLDWTGTVTGTNNYMAIPSTWSIALPSGIAGNITLNDKGTGFDYVWFEGPITGNSGLTIASGATSTNPILVAINGTFSAANLTGTLTVGGGNCSTTLDDTGSGGLFNKNLLFNLTGKGIFEPNGGGTETFGGLTGNGTIDVETAGTAGLTIDTSGTYSGPYTFNGTITGGSTTPPTSYTLTKTGTGQQILGSNVNVAASWFGLNVTGGELTVNGAIGSAAHPAASIAVAAGATLDGGGSVTGPLAFTGGTVTGLTVNATGISSISGNPTINSNLNVSSGILTVTGTPSGSGAWTVAPGATLTGNGTINKAIPLSGTLGGTLTIGGAVTSTGGTLSPGFGPNGAGHTPGALAISGGNSLSLDSGSVMNFNLGANTTPGTTYDQITVGGAATLAGTVNLYNTGSLAAGDYHLMAYASYTGSLTLGNQPAGFAYTLTPTSTYLDLLVGNSYTWNYTSSGQPTGGNWNTPAYWTVTGGGTGTVPGSSDAAVINLSGGSYQWYVPFSMTLSAPMTVNSFAVNNGGPFSWSNTLSVTGSSGFTVQNTVMLGGYGTLNVPSGVTVNGYHGAGAGYNNWGGTIGVGVSIVGNVTLNGAALATSGTITGNVTALPNSDNGTAYQSYLGGNGDSTTMTITGNVNATNTDFNPGGLDYYNPMGSNRSYAGYFVGKIAIGGNLTVDNLSTLNFGVRNSGNYSQITVGGAAAFASTGSTVVNVNLGPVSNAWGSYLMTVPAIPGDYHLMTYASYTGSVALGTVWAGASYGLGNNCNAGGYYCTLTAYPTYLDFLVSAAAYTWSGASGANWGASGSWTGSGIPTPYTFPDLANVTTFNLGGNPTVNLEAAHNANSLVLSGGGALTINGAGTLTVVNNGLTLAAGQTLTANVPIVFTDGSAITVNGGTLNGAGTITANVTMTGGALGTITFPGNTITVNSGSNTVSAASFALINESAAVAGTTLALSPGGEGSAGKMTSTNRDTLNYANVTNTFNFDLGANTTAGTTYDQIALTNTRLSTLVGTVNLNPLPGFGLGMYTLISSTAASDLSGLTFGGTAPSVLTYAVAGGTTGSTAYMLTVGRSATAGAFYWAGGSSGNWSTAPWNVGSSGGPSYTGVYPGLVTADTAAIDLAAQSSPTITMDAPAAISSLTLSNSGTLTLTGGNALSVGNSVTIAANQGLAGNGTLNLGGQNLGVAGGTVSGTLSVTGNVSSTGGRLAPGAAGAAGTIHVNGNVTLDHGTVLNYALGAPGTIGGGINDLIAITGDLSLDGTLNVTALSGFGIGTYSLFTYSGALTQPSGGLTMGTLPDGFGYTIDTGTHGQVILDVAEPFQPGDTNRDGAVNSLDIDAIYHHFGADASSQWKVATDGLAVGQQDVTYELHTYFHTNYADANLDRKTDFVDFQVLLDHWQASGPSIGWAQGDFDGSGTVDFLDFQKLLDYWNPGGWSFAPAQAPEPASLALILLGGLGLLRRRK